jgi:D-alanine-D-alanine ligase
MEIAVMINLTGEILQGRGRDRTADLDVLDTADAVLNALRARGYAARIVNICAEGFAGLRAFDAVFNMAETVAGFALTVADIVEHMDRIGIPYSGPNAEALARCADKATAKAVLISQGLPTPRYQVFSHAADLRTTLAYPLIVKPLHEEGSVGIDDDAVVDDECALGRRIAEIVRRYEQPALVEEYIDGREISASVIGEGPDLHVLPLVETLFIGPPERPRILTFDAKWTPGSPGWEHVLSGQPANLDGNLEAEIKALAARACVALGCRDYTRVDFRLRGRSVYILEANPSPCLSPNGSSFMSAAQMAGFTYETIIERILTGVLQRLAQRHHAGSGTQPTCERNDHDQGSKTGTAAGSPPWQCAEGP